MQKIRALASKMAERFHGCSLGPEPPISVCVEDRAILTILSFLQFFETNNFAFEGKSSIFDAVRARGGTSYSEWGSLGQNSYSV